MEALVIPDILSLREIYIMARTVIPKSYRPRRRRGRKAMRSRGGRRHRAPNAATAGRQQYATITETLEYSDLSANVMTNSVFSLGQFDRALAVATSFQYYRAKTVTWTYEPQYNTFQETTGASISKPYLYLAMNRTQIPLLNGDLENIQAMGSKPLTLTSKKSLTYKPNWCSPGLSAIANASYVLVPQGSKVQYSWIAVPDTNATLNLQPAAHGDQLFNTWAVYNGHLSFIDQSQSVTPATVARITATVVWEFKGARFDKSHASPGQVVPA